MTERVWCDLCRCEHEAIAPVWPTVGEWSVCSQCGCSARRGACYNVECESNVARDGAPCGACESGYRGGEGADGNAA
jgi:hypothetical protein